MRIYLAGPITGVEGYRGRFAVARRQCETKGHRVMDPSVLPEGFDWQDYMPICLAMLQCCEAICLLPGWEQSRGAQKELRMALYWGKTVYRGTKEVPNPAAWTETKPGKTRVE